MARMQPDSPDRRALRIHGQLKALSVSRHQAGWIVWEEKSGFTYFGPAKTRKEAREWLANLAETDDPRAVIAGLAKRAAEDWFRQQTANMFESFYLYWRRGSLNQAGELRAFALPETPPRGNWIQASTERIRLAFTIDQAAYWIAEIARNLPVLAEVSEIR